MDSILTVTGQFITLYQRAHTKSLVVDRMTGCGDVADFPLCISVIFLLPTEVLVTDSESQIPISYSSLIVTMALSGLVFEI